MTEQKGTEGEKVRDFTEVLARQLAARPEIAFALLYGSAAEGRPFRDLDIGVFVDRALVPAPLDLDFAFGLADRLEREVHFPVDIRVINDAPLPFRYNVSRGVRLVVNSEDVFSSFLERTWDEFFDFEPIAMQYLKEFA